MTQSIFNSKAIGEHKLYARIRDEVAWGEQTRHVLEQMWVEYYPFAPKGFRRKLQFEFHQRWWEMYLTIGLCGLGMPVRSSRNDNGPDLMVETGNSGTRIWVEAVAPKIGISKDCVPDLIMDSGQDLPKRECLLRLLQVVTEKRDRMADYVANNTVSRKDACIIALSACNLNQFGSLLDFPQPAPLSILAGAGNQVISSDKSRSPYSSRQTTLSRNSGSLVHTTLFEQAEFSIISAVLYSNCDPLNAPDEPHVSLSLFLNPNAKIKLPMSFYEKIPTWHVADQYVDKTIWQIMRPGTMQ